MSQAVPLKAARKQAELCIEILIRVNQGVALGQPADHILACLYRQHREFGARDRRFFSNLAFSWFRWRGWLPAGDQPQESDAVLAYLLDAVDVHPAIACLAERCGWTQDLQPLGNKDLLEKARVISERLGLSCPCGIEQLVPSWVGQCLYYPGEEGQKDHLVRCVEAFQSRPPLWIRMKKQAGKQAVSLVSQYADDGPARPPSSGAGGPVRSPFSTAFRLRNRADWETLKIHTGPALEIQDLASQCVGALCAPAPGERWWDVCAGTGGKTLHLADQMGSGFILATDIRKPILDQCARRVRRSGIRVIKLRLWDGNSDPAPSCMFDGVLVDAPCSGIGTWHRNPDARWRTSPEIIKTRADNQGRLLRTAADKVRSGGRLVYSTCTLTEAENNGVVHLFLKNRPDFQLVPGPHPISGEETSGMIWIWPWQAGCNGMFVARMKRS